MPRHSRKYANISLEEGALAAPVIKTATSRTAAPCALAAALWSGKTCRGNNCTLKSEWRLLVLGPVDSLGPG